MAHGVFSKEGIKFHVVVAYAPTETNGTMEEFEEFLTQLEKTCNSHRSTPLLVLGDFNVTIGSRENELVPKHIGKWLPSKDWSKHGILLVEFFVKSDLMILNSYFSKALARKCSWVHPETGAVSLKDYALVKNKGAAKGLSIRDVRASWKDSNRKDNTMIVIIATLHGDVRKAKTRPMMTPKSQPSQRQKCEYILHSKVNRIKFREELKGELEKTPNHTDLPSVLDRVVSTCEIVDTPVVKTGCWARFITSEGWGILKEREIAYRTYLQDRKNPALAQILKTNNQLAKTVTKNGREKALEPDLAEFARLKDNGDLRGAYRQLKVTLRSFNMSWFERGRKSVGPLKQDFCRHYSELFKARPAPGDDGIARTATLTTQTPLAPSVSVNPQQELVEERRLSANPTNVDGRGTQTQLVRALPNVCDLVDEEPDGPTQ